MHHVKSPRLRLAAMALAAAWIGAGCHDDVTVAGTSTTPERSSETGAARSLDGVAQDLADASNGVVSVTDAACVAERVTVGTAVQAAWALVLATFGGEGDVLFGATRACRRTALGGEGTSTMVGLMFNTLPLRAWVDPDAALFPWLRDLRARARAIASMRISWRRPGWKRAICRANSEPIVPPAPVI